MALPLLRSRLGPPGRWLLPHQLSILSLVTVVGDFSREYCSMDVVTSHTDKDTSLLARADCITCAFCTHEMPLYNFTLNASLKPPLPRGWHVPTVHNSNQERLDPMCSEPSSSVAVTKKAPAQGHYHLGLPRLKPPKSHSHCLKRRPLEAALPKPHHPSRSGWPSCLPHACTRLCHTVNGAPQVLGHHAGLQMAQVLGMLSSLSFSMCR